MSDVTPTTRVAYVKFMAKKIKGEDPETMNEQHESAIETKAETKDVVVVAKEPVSAKKGLNIILSFFSNLIQFIFIEVVVPVSEPLKVIEHLEGDKDFRSRTPIPEDPNEERTLSPEIKEADVISDDPIPSTSSISPEVSKSPIHSVADPLSSQSSVSRAPSPINDISRAVSPELTPKTDELLVKLEPVPTVSRAASPDIPQKPKESLAVPVAPILPLSPGKSKATGRKIAGWL